MLEFGKKEMMVCEAAYLDFSISFLSVSFKAPQGQAPPLPVLHPLIPVRIDIQNDPKLISNLCAAPTQTHQPGATLVLSPLSSIRSMFSQSYKYTSMNLPLTQTQTTSVYTVLGHPCFKET